MANKEEKTQRVRYIHALNRFTQGVSRYLFKAQDVTKEQFDKKVTQGLKLLQRATATTLYKGEFQELEALAKKIESYKESEATIEEIKKDILYSANQLEKSQNNRKYKKPKHTKNITKEWD